MKQLRIKDKALFDKFLSIKRHELSTYAFANIYIWKSLFRVSWAVLEDNLCIFFNDHHSTFMYLPPIGRKCSKEVIRKCFEIMDGLNTHSDISRIENVEGRDIKFYRQLGFDCSLKSQDYLYKRQDLALLNGERFKSKRNSCNYFVKNYIFSYRPYGLEDKPSCLSLCERWIRQRRKVSKSSYYQYMLEDSFECQRIALDKVKRLGLVGRVISLNKRIVAYTHGFPLNRDTFCILFEITDHSIKGIAQFIFREFSKELKNYKYINAMDDSGLDNLQEAKLSYRPEKLIPSYIIKRKCSDRN